MTRPFTDGRRSPVPLRSRCRALRLSLRPSQLGGTDDELRDMVEYVTAQAGSGIIYCQKRREVDRIAGVLCDADVDVAAYHGGMDAAKRRKLQGDWTEGTTRVMVATIAFGMVR